MNSNLYPRTIFDIHLPAPPPFDPLVFHRAYSECVRMFHFGFSSFKNNLFSGIAVKVLMRCPNGAMSQDIPLLILESILCIHNFNSPAYANSWHWASKHADVARVWVDILI